MKVEEENSSRSHFLIFSSLSGIAGNGSLSGRVGGSFLIGHAHGSFQDMVGCGSTSVASGLLPGVDSDIASHAALMGTL